MSSEYDPFAGIMADDLVPVVEDEANAPAERSEPVAKKKKKKKKQKAHVTKKTITVTGKAPEVEILLTPVEALESMRRYRARNPEKVRRSSDRSATKRYIRSATYEELKDIEDVVSKAIANLAR